MLNLVKIEHSREHPEMSTVSLQYFCFQASPEKNVVATFNLLENPCFHMPNFSVAGDLMQWDNCDYFRVEQHCQLK